MDDIEQRFLDAISKNPDDEEARTVYADWLEERGDPRGEYLRLELQLYKIPVRLVELEKVVDAAWTGIVSRTFDVQLGNPGSDKIRVILAIREITSLGLKDAKDLVDAASDARPVTVRKRVARHELDSIEAKLAVSGASFQIVGHAAWHRSHGSEALVVIVLRSVVDTQRIAVMKLVRELTGLGLKAAKDLVDGVAGGTPATLAAVTMKTATDFSARFDGLGSVTIGQ
jgi:uncharacterized protein (TIGR02996 family)